MTVFDTLKEASRNLSRELGAEGKEPDAHVADFNRAAEKFVTATTGLIRSRGLAGFDHNIRHDELENEIESLISLLRTPDRYEDYITLRAYRITALLLEGGYADSHFRPLVHCASDALHVG
ncbi:MAG: hypothetical protein IT558_05085 [Alphaproteobacteria bacterium]|nr:hypothetical protein [Alphaproteobacteria bacterium]